MRTARRARQERKDHATMLGARCRERAHLGVKPETIYGCIEREKLAADKVSRLWKLKASEVQECVLQRRAPEHWETE